MALTDVTINYWAVLVGAIIYMAVGFLWYSKVLFGKIWMDLMGFTERQMQEAKEKGMGKTMALAFLSALVVSFVLAHFVDYTNSTTFFEGMSTGFLIWIGFAVPLTLSSVLWEGKSWKLFFISIANLLVSLALMAGVLAVWT